MINIVNNYMNFFCLSYIPKSPILIPPPPPNRVFSNKEKIDKNNKETIETSLTITTNRHKSILKFLVSIC